MTVARLHDVRYGDIEQLIRQLGGSGLDARLIRRLNRDSQLREWWIKALREHISSPRTLEIEGFTPTAEVAQRLMTRSRGRAWDLPTAALIGMTSANFGAPASSSVEAVVVPDIWLGNFETTFRELWEWFQNVYNTPGSSCDLDLAIDSERLSPVVRDTHETVRSLRWAVVDMTANTGKAPGDCDLRSLAGLQVLTAAILHPAWFKQVITTTSFWLGGVKARERRSGPWTFTPMLSWHMNTIVLGIDYSVAQRHNFVAPTFRDL